MTFFPCNRSFLAFWRARNWIFESSLVTSLSTKTGSLLGPLMSFFFFIIDSLCSREVHVAIIFGSVLVLTILMLCGFWNVCAYFAEILSIASDASSHYVTFNPETTMLFFLLLRSIWEMSLSRFISAFSFVNMSTWFYRPSIFSHNWCSRELSSKRQTAQAKK